MRVFVDANILVSGIAFHGLENGVFKLGTAGRVELVTSEDVIDETIRALNEKFPALAHRAKDFLQLANVRVITRPAYADRIEKQELRDASDRHVLAAALASQSDVLLTGDKDLLSLARPPLLVKNARQLLIQTP